MSARFHERRRSEPTLASMAAPELGARADAERMRGRVRRLSLFIVALWALAIAAIVGSAG